MTEIDFKQHCEENWLWWLCEITSEKTLKFVASFPKETPWKEISPYFIAHPDIPKTEQPQRILLKNVCIASEFWANAFVGVQKSDWDKTLEQVEAECSKSAQTT